MLEPGIGKRTLCTIVILRRPGHHWPVLLAANRDEMADRRWKPPGRHWPDLPQVIAGKDELANGSWLGINESGVVAAVLNRIHTLGPLPGFRSRGELILRALRFPDASSAASALLLLGPREYRPFNLVVVDARDGYCLRLRSAGHDRDEPERIEMMSLPPGLTMITAFDGNDIRSPRTRRYLPMFQNAAAPEPDHGEWSEWRSLLAARGYDPDAGPGGAMTVRTDTGFGTVCSSLMALPGEDATATVPIWLFASGPPDQAPFRPVPLPPEPGAGAKHPIAVNDPPAP
jgi:hypothetical protein